jgi:hypothetical protein
MAPKLQQMHATASLPDVRGAIRWDSRTMEGVIAAGCLEGGAKGVRFGFRHLLDAMDIARSRFFEGEKRVDLERYTVDIQITCQRGSDTPILIMTSPEGDGGSRECVALAGARVIEDPRTSRDAVEVRE